MKRLTLMRHARAELKHSKPVADFERPLDRRGVAEIANMSERLLSQELIPDLILTSPALRAVQSAESVARTLGLAMRRVQRDDRLYLATAEELLAVLRDLGPQVAHAMLVGHNPGLTELARRLTADPSLGELATAAVATMSFDATSWRRLEAGAAREVVHDSPQRFFQLWA